MLRIEGGAAAVQSREEGERGEARGTAGHLKDHAGGCTWIRCSRWLAGWLACMMRHRLLVCFLFGYSGSAPLTGRGGRQSHLADIIVHRVTYNVESIIFLTIPNIIIHDYLEFLDYISNTSERDWVIDGRTL